MGGPVLIETLWNVKQDSSGIQIGKGCGINRNIVECKGMCIKSISTAAGLVLIETLWNVK